MITCPD